MRQPGPDTSSGLPQEWRPPSYWPFVLPALIIVLAVIVFPWIFTVWMSLHEWKVGQPTIFVGLSNYLRMPKDPRFVEAIWHTLVYTALSVILPLFFGTHRIRFVRLDGRRTGRFLLQLLDPLFRLLQLLLE